MAREPSRAAAWASMAQCRRAEQELLTYLPTAGGVPRDTAGDFCLALSSSGASWRAGPSSPGARTA